MEAVSSITVKLIQAVKSDVFNQDEIPKENKRLALFDLKENDFFGVYRISGTDLYSVCELYKLLQSGFLYRFSSEKNDFGQSVNVDLYQAEEFDFFDSPKFVKENTVYFAEIDGVISGPFILKDSADKLKLRQAINSKKLFIPMLNKNTSFKDYQKAS